MAYRVMTYIVMAYKVMAYVAQRQVSVPYFLGIVPQLDEECRVPKGSASGLMQKLVDTVGRIFVANICKIMFAHSLFISKGLLTFTA